MKEIKQCNDCGNCLPIGEGDFICSEHPGSIVLENYEPGEDFCSVEGKSSQKNKEEHPHEPASSGALEINQFYCK